MSISRINNNVSALFANRALNQTGLGLEKNIQRLSSGLRIDRAGDDAAGLTIRERLRSHIKGTDQSIRNAQDGMNMVNTTESALNAMVSSLQRIRVLTVQAGNTGTNDFGSLQAIQDEIFQQIDEVNRIANTARFSTRLLLTGENANVTDIVKGQEDLGIKISSDPNASSLRSGTSVLNIIRTHEGSENILPSKKVDGQAIFATGIKNTTDIAVTAAQFTTVGGPAVSTTLMNTSTFDGVSITANDLISFQGVLSDGITPFAGSISVINNDFDALVSQIQTAIDNAEIALFGGNSADISKNFIQTHVSIAAAGVSLGEGAGRLRFLSAQAEGTSATNHADITVAPSLFEIEFSIFNQNGDIKHQVESTRDDVNGQRVGGQFGNTLQAITGSTFNTGNFNIEVSDIIAPQRRQMKTELVFRDSSGSILSRDTSLANVGQAAIINGTFINDVFTAGNDGIAFGLGDTINIQGTNADGSTFKTVFTITDQPADDVNLGDGLIMSLGGLIDELNHRDRTVGVNGPNQQSAFVDAKVTLDGDGTLRLFDDVAEHSMSSLFMIVSDFDTNKSLADRSQIIYEGNPELATVQIDGGPRQQVRVGEQVQLFGRVPANGGTHQPSLTMRIGAGYRDSSNSTLVTQGSDIAEIQAQQFTGRLNGGPAVTFQNGYQGVYFESGSSKGVAETLMLDFDAILDITDLPSAGSTNLGQTILLSTIDHSLNFQVGPFHGQDLQLNIPDLRGDNLGFGRGSGKTVSEINVMTSSGVNESLEIIDKALDQVSRTRSALGAFTNRLESTISRLSSSEENLTSAESRLSDVNIAEETSAFASNQIIYQASTSVLAQANRLPQNLLSLLG